MPAKYPLSLCIAALPLVSAFERIAGFSPASNVVDYAALDLDMERIIYYLEKKDPSDYDRVYKIYTQGGSSESTATITFPEGQDAIKRGDTVTGFNEAGSGSSTGTNEATGQVVYVNPVATSIRIEYTVPEKNELSHAGCRVGGLAPEEHITDGCFKISNGLTIGGNLYYPNSIDNTKAGRTLQELSLVTTDKMRSCSIGCPYWLFLQYADWYGDDDYGDKFVKAAIGTPETSFQPNKIGFTKHDMDFSNAERKARFELIEKGAMLLTVWMYVYRMLEVAVDQCIPNVIAGNDPAVRSWDGAVAFYTGSLEGSAGALSKGVFPHNQADKRCHNFKTCGPGGGKIGGASMVNHKLFKILQTGQSALLMGECAALPPLVREAVAQMTIPLLQGAIRYAQINSRTGGDTPAFPEKAAAEGTAFAAAVVPRIAACPGGKDDAEFIWEAMKHGAYTPYPYKDIKSRFEKYYSCLNVTCAEVGGFFDNRESGGKYYPDSEPCFTPSPDALLDNGQIVGVVIGALVACVLLFFSCVCVWRLVHNERKGVPIFTPLEPMQRDASNVPGARA